MEINVLGFSACGLEGCDCGARVVLGLTHEAARRLRVVLEREGFSFRSVPGFSVRSAPRTPAVNLATGKPIQLAVAEPFTGTALADFEEYAAR